MSNIMPINGDHSELVKWHFIRQMSNRYATIPHSSSYPMDADGYAERSQRELLPELAAYTRGSYCQHISN
ncbi:hypothetical protein ACLKA7_000334 [Drosophila subpalustris]